MLHPSKIAFVWFDIFTNSILNQLSHHRFVLPFSFLKFYSEKKCPILQSADCRNGILAPPFPRINELWNWKSRLKLFRSNTYSTSCGHTWQNLIDLDFSLWVLLLWLVWLDQISMFVMGGLMAQIKYVIFISSTRI